MLKRRKMLTDQRTVDAAKAAVGAHTETEAVDAALDLAVFRAEVFRALDRLAAVGGLADLTPTHPQITTSELNACDRTAPN